MTDDNQKLLDELLPRIRSTVWQAALSCSLIVGALIYAVSRMDIIELRTELRRQQETHQTNNQNVHVQKSGIYETLTAKIWEDMKDGDVRRTPDGHEPAAGIDHGL